MEDVLNEAEHVVKKLASLGAEYQKAVEALGASEPIDLVHQETMRRLEDEFDATYSPGPLRVVRALEIRGYKDAANAVHDLWQTVFWVTGLVAVSVGVEYAEVLEFDVVGKREAALDALRRIAETSRSGSDSRHDPHLATLTDGALMADKVTSVGSDYQLYLADSDMPLPMGEDDDETNPEARLRVAREFEALNPGSIVEQLRELGAIEAAAALEDLVRTVSRIVDVRGQSTDGSIVDIDLLAKRDSVIDELTQAGQSG